MLSPVSLQLREDCLMRALVGRLLGIVERRHHVIDVDVRRRITLRDGGEKLGIARGRRETAVSLEGLLDREKSPVFWVR